MLAGFSEAINGGLVIKFSFALRGSKMSGYGQSMNATFPAIFLFAAGRELRPLAPRLAQFCWVFIVLAGLPSPVRGAELTFDAWVDSFSAEWVRGDPILATTTQYFDDAEQEDLDRQLTPITKEYRAARVALAQRHPRSAILLRDRRQLPIQVLLFCIIEVLRRRGQYGVSAYPLCRKGIYPGIKRQLRTPNRAGQSGENNKNPAKLREARSEGAQFSTRRE